MTPYFISFLVLQILISMGENYKVFADFANHEHSTFYMPIKLVIILENLSAKSLLSNPRKFAPSKLICYTVAVFVDS